MKKKGEREREREKEKDILINAVLMNHKNIETKMKK
jgi:hypothetical protein